MENCHASLPSDLKSCSRDRDVHCGKVLHAKAVECSEDVNMYVATALINMYGKCGSMFEARCVFDSIQKPDVVSWTAMLLEYAGNGEGKVALDMFFRMDTGCPPNSFTFVAALKACGSLAASGDEDYLEQGRKIHLKVGSCLNQYVQASLIDMYAKCGSIAEAFSVFETMQKPDVVCWNALLFGYADKGEGSVVLDLFHRMKVSSETVPNSLTYVAVLKACTSLAVNGGEKVKEDYLKQGRAIHSEVGKHLDHYVQCTLIDMYAKCGSMDEAQKVFDSIKKPNVTSWNNLLLGYADEGEGKLTLDLFSKMKAGGGIPDRVTYIAALKACGSLALNANSTEKGVCLERGRELHLELGGSQFCFRVREMLMNLSFENVKDAYCVFYSMKEPDVVAWTTRLLRYAMKGLGQKVTDLFHEMKHDGPNALTYVAATKACSSLQVSGDGSRCMERWGKLLSEIDHQLDHNFIRTLNYNNNNNIDVITSLIDMYAKCGSMFEARCIFNSVRNPDVVLWNVLLLGYVENGDAQITFDMFSRMKEHGCTPTSVTYVAVLKACTSLAVNGDDKAREFWLERGRKLHLQVGFYLNHNVQGTLIDMYTKCGSMADARIVFDSMHEPDVIPWTTLILGYAENEEGHIALDLFSRMKASGCAPNSLTYVAALRACTSLAVNENDIEIGSIRGKELHLEVGCHLDHYVQSTLIVFYAKCGDVNGAHGVFDNIQKPNLLCWNALLLGYYDNGEGYVVLKLFSKMKLAGCLPDSVTYIAVLKACALMGALALGRKFHSELKEFSFQIITCLVDFYAKCGSMLEAHEVLNLHTRKDAKPTRDGRDVIIWTALLAGYARFGDTDSVFRLFQAMQDLGLQPNAVTFLCLLLCCSHAGLVDDAKEYLEAMRVQYRVTPVVMHYNCLVDGLGRANQLNEALWVIREMPCNATTVTWMTFLGACRRWKNVELGRGAFQTLADMNRRKSSAYVLMAQLYGSTGLWEERARVLQIRTKYATCT